MGVDTVIAMLPAADRPCREDFWTQCPRVYGIALPDAATMSRGHGYSPDYDRIGRKLGFRQSNYIHA